MKARISQIWECMYMLVLLPIIMPVLLLICVIRPFCLVRFGELISDGIGHYAANTEVYLCERDSGINVPHGSYFDIWYNMPKICNLQLKKMWERVLRVYPRQIVRPIDQWCRILPWMKLHHISLRADHGRDIHNVMERYAPHLRFLPDEDKLGRDGLRKLGLPDGQLFVCFHARDSSYMSTIYRNDRFNYHSYRDSNIHNYIRATEEMVRRGYYAVRMGEIVKEALGGSRSGIIDYATNGSRNAFMDIYLGANCKFFITSGTGIDAIPEVFVRPLVIVNYVPIEYVRSWNRRYLTIFKKHWLRGEQRFMKFREILESGAGRFLRTEQYEKAGIELIDNTPDEIAAVVIEMEERVRGVWQSGPEDDELQRRFWRVFKSSHLHGQFRALIGAEFLRKNRDWLD